MINTRQSRISCVQDRLECFIKAIIPQEHLLRFVVDNVTGLALRKSGQATPVLLLSKRNRDVDTPSANPGAPPTWVSYNAKTSDECAVQTRSTPTIASTWVRARNIVTSMTSNAPAGKSHPAPPGSLNPEISSAIRTDLKPPLQAQSPTHLQYPTTASTHYCAGIGRRRGRAESNKPIPARGHVLQHSLRTRLYLKTSSDHTRVSMRGFVSTMAAGARKFAPLKEGAAADTHLPRLKVGNSYLLHILSRMHLPNTIRVGDCV